MMGWYEDRFREEPTRSRQDCRACGRSMWLPKSKLHWHLHCSLECTRATAAGEREKRRRDCETCGAPFYPRQVQLDNGGGRFCSQRCNTAGREALLSPEVQARASARMREMHAAGLVKVCRGDKKPNWKGGPAERPCSARKYFTALDRAREAERNRIYRQKNPDKVREFANRRQGRKVGRLPRGTVKRIGEMQRWKCAICATGVRRGYHLDHIMPLARDGEHAPRNLQLLCQTCNVRKNAKDPIAYMREIGRLL